MIKKECSTCVHRVNFNCNLGSHTANVCLTNLPNDIYNYYYCYWEPKESKETNLTSKDLLEEVIELLNEKGKGYENGVERSMQKIVTSFNVTTGHNLTEVEGYFFMQCLKNVRYFTNDDVVHRDSLLDDISYSSLKAEAALKK